MTNKRKCMFIEKRICPLEFQDVTQEKCQICVEAWRIKTEKQSLAIQELKGLLNLPLSTNKELPSTGNSLFSKKNATNTEYEQSHKKIRELDKSYLKDELSAQEYINKRRKLVDELLEKKTLKRVNYQRQTQRVNFQKFTKALSNQDSINLILTKITNDKYQIFKKSMNSNLINNITDKKIIAITNFFSALEDQDMSSQILINGCKISLILRKDNCFLFDLIPKEENSFKYSGLRQKLVLKFHEVENWVNFFNNMKLES